MAKVKITRKGLKEDEVHEFGIRVAFWFQQNQKMLLIAAVLIVVALVGKTVISNSRENAMLTLNAEYSYAFELYQNARTIPLGLEARDDQLADAAQLFIELAENHPNKPIGQLAAFHQANILFYQEEFAEARAAFQELLSKAKKPETICGIHLALGDCYSSEAFRAQDSPQLIEQALASYDAAYEAFSDSYLGYYALFCKAHLLKHNPETRAEAVEIFRMIEEQRPAENASMLAEIEVEEFNRDEAIVLERIIALAKMQTLAKIAEADRLELLDQRK